MLSKQVIAALMYLVLQLGQEMVHSFGNLPHTRLRKPIQMQAFTLQNYVVENLLVDDVDMKRTVETELFDGSVGFDQTRCYLLLVDYNVRSVDDIDQPSTLETFGFLDRLLGKMKSSKQVHRISYVIQMFFHESM